MKMFFCETMSTFISSRINLMTSKLTTELYITFTLTINKQANTHLLKQVYWEIAFDIQRYPQNRLPPPLYVSSFIPPHLYGSHFRTLTSNPELTSTWVVTSIIHLNIYIIIKQQSSRVHRRRPTFSRSQHHDKGRNGESCSTFICSFNGLPSTRPPLIPMTISIHKRRSMKRVFYIADMSRW